MINSYFIKDDKTCTVLQYRVCFHHYLTNKKHGTLCYGTLVDIDKMKFFVVEDVLSIKETSLIILIILILLLQFLISLKIFSKKHLHKMIV